MPTLTPTPTPTPTPTIAGLGEQAADAIRALNHRTRHADAFTDPAELSSLLADLATTAQRLPQLLQQISQWLSHEHHSAALRADTEHDTANAIDAATAHLSCASRRSSQLADLLDTAHQHTAMLARP